MSDSYVVHGDEGLVKELMDRPTDFVDKMSLCQLIGLFRVIEDELEGRLNYEQD